MSAPVSENLHGTAIAVGGRAALIRGPSGAGKSDLALRIIGLPPGPLVAHPPVLVADDRVLATATTQGVRLSCPAALVGLLEVRGIGIVRVPCMTDAILHLVVDLVAPETIERMPDAGRTTMVCSHAVPCVRLAAFEASAAIKLMILLEQYSRGDAPG